MLTCPPRKMPVLILAEPFSALWVAPSFLHLLLCNFAEFSQCNQCQVRWSPGSCVLHMSPGSTHCPHRVLTPANCLLQETQEKARVQGLYLLTKHTTTLKASQNNKVTALFPSHEQMGSDANSRNIRQGRERGVNFLLQTELGLMQLKGKTKSPNFF